MNAFVVVGSISAFVGVAAGAFGAHALKTRLSPEMLAVFEVGARYHLVHALAIVLTGVFAARNPSAAGAYAGYAFLFGTVLFSGSLYALALSGVKGLGAVTPLGGLLFLSGWALLALAAWRGVRA